ncbi:MAG: DsbA family protein [Geminicoccaceae bacterium]
MLLSTLRLAVVLLALAVAPRLAHAVELGEPAIGDPNAPVTIIEFASLTCPHCASFHVNTLPELEKRYIDTGKVRLVLRDFPLDEMALKASVIAHCAGPDRYPQFVQVFFSQQASWTRSDDPEKALRQLAQLGGLGADQIDACLADKSLEDTILQARLDGQQKYNIESTPSFIIGGKTHSGDQSIEKFAELIDPLLPQ